MEDSGVELVIVAHPVERTKLQEKKGIEELG
jgi:hypothetical protein